MDLALVPRGGEGRLGVDHSCGNSVSGSGRLGSK